MVESLRSPAPPFVVATYYTRTGEVDVDPVSEELLVGAARRTLAGTRLLWERSQGSEPPCTPTAPDGTGVAPTQGTDGRGRRDAHAGGHVRGQRTP